RDDLVTGVQTCALPISFGGGFVVQAFIAYWFTARFHTSLGTLGVVFFVIGLLQTASFLAATGLAERFGLLSTMVFTHLPSNLLRSEERRVGKAICFGRW